MGRLKTLCWGFFLMITVSLSWLFTIWTRFGLSDPIQTTDYILNDLKWLGPAAFIFDICFFYFIYKIVLPKKEESMIDEFIKTP